MKKTATFLLGVAVFFVPFVSHATVLRSNPVSQTTFPTVDYHNTNDWSQSRFGVGYGTFFSSSTPIGGIQLWFGVKSATSTSPIRICFDEYTSFNGYTAQQAFEEQYGQSPYNTNAVCTGSLTLATDANGLFSASLSVPFSANPERYYAIEIGNVSGNGFSPVTSIVGSPYGDGANTFYSGFPYATSTNSIYYQIYSGQSPTQFNATLFFPSVATSTVLVTCGNNLASTTGLIDSVGASFGYGLCVAGTFLFVPSQDSINQFGNFTTAFQSKIPFSYFYDITSTVDSLTASSTDNLPTYSIDLHATGIGSTTALGNILPPSMDLLSTSTINHFLPAGVRDSLFFLASAAIWLSVGMMMYRRITGLFKNTA